MLAWLLQAAAEAEADGAKQAHQQKMDESEIAHLSELAELRERVMELQTKDSHTPDELAELDMLRNRVLGFQASTPGLPIAPAALMQDSSSCATAFANQLPLLTSCDQRDRWASD